MIAASNVCKMIQVSALHCITSATAIRAGRRANILLDRLDDKTQVNCSGRCSNKPCFRTACRTLEIHMRINTGAMRILRIVVLPHRHGRSSGDRVKTLLWTVSGAHLESAAKTTPPAKVVAMIVVCRNDKHRSKYLDVERSIRPVDSLRHEAEAVQPVGNKLTPS
jgi:hypothetical protein